MIGARYTPDDGCPWATTEMLEGRSPFDVFVEAVQAGRGQSLSVAAVAAAVLIASRRSSRKVGGLRALRDPRGWGAYTRRHALQADQGGGLRRMLARAAGQVAA